MTTSRLLLLATLVVAGACGAYLIWLQDGTPLPADPPSAMSPQAGGSSSMSPAGDEPPPEPVEPAPLEEAEADHQAGPSVEALEQTHADRSRTVHRLSQLPKGDRSLYSGVSSITGIRWWEIYDMAHGTDKEQALREAWAEVRTVFRDSSLNLEAAKVAAHEKELEAGEYHVEYPKRIIGPDGQPGYQGKTGEQLSAYGGYVGRCTEFAPALGRSITKVTIVMPGDYPELDKAAATFDRVKSRAASRFRSILGVDAPR